ncbi:hypothetical protein LC1Nh_0494 [Candidatus Nanohalobium constans]|uniref:Uncharacterized protein n=2 Tax=Candidatus Nanohalobium constans TaxID=2565781 RepID=A0A5Q0UFS4_9ARCH|nr:hypothetical protein LC1Nh_0494 [Candidatus Nanohalobium constans]
MKIEVEEIIEVGIGSIFIILAASIVAQIYLPQYESIINQFASALLELIIPAILGIVVAVLVIRIIEELPS